jgi:general secretion pathway protein G
MRITLIEGVSNMRLVPSRLQSAQQAQRRRDAFTLMEILVVVAIIVVLAGVATVSVFRYLEESRISAARSSCVTLAKAAQSYIVTSGSPPNSLQDLLNPPDGRQRYIESPDMLIDPWNNPYQMSITEDSTGNPEVEVYTQRPNLYISSNKAKNTTGK